MIAIDQYKAEDVDDVLAAELSTLTLPNGCLAGMFDRCRKRHGATGRAFIATTPDAAVAGWLLRWTYTPRMDGRWHAYLYVQPGSRRGGIGTNLVTEALRSLRTASMIGHAWDDTSTAFYTALPHHDQLRVAGEVATAC